MLQVHDNKNRVLHKLLWPRKLGKSLCFTTRALVSISLKSVGTSCEEDVFHESVPPYHH